MSQFPNGKLWRFAVADLDGTIITWLDPLAHARNVTYTLNAPAVATGQVPSDNFQINALVGSGTLQGDPLVSYSDRILLGFRRDGTAVSTVNPGPWTIRFAGLIEQLEDAAGSDDATSTYTAYDPWQYLMSRPIRQNDLNLPPQTGLTFSGAVTTLDQIAVNLIDNTSIADGWPYIDTATGTIENIPFTDEINFQQATSVGDALTQICNTGLCDIWMEPVYDPTVTPPILARLNIFAQMGSTQNDAVMSWDSPGKSLVGINRLLDGAQLANTVQFYNGQAGPAVTPQVDATSEAKYGSYWAQQVFPQQIETQAVIDIAQNQLSLRKIGHRTLQVNPAPERAPDPFTSYFLGDLVPVYATKRLRQTLPAPQETTNYVRVYGIPVDISDNALESVAQLLISPDGFTP